MPGRYSMRRRRSSFAVVDSNKNVQTEGYGISGTTVIKQLAIAKDNAVNTVSNDVQRGCKIFRFWFVLDVCGLGGTGVLNNMDAYVIKNPGFNLTPPDPGSEGTSNEKKFIFKSWHAMIMRNQDGNNPYHWEGWIKIPKIYQRFGADDRLQFVLKTTASLTGHASYQVIYKWFK